ncbi:MAG: HlyC/CorC family transporter [Planctomycetes bacterium]|nr:HlyC/CorC family transporter [Planctomycetota bacterium]
MIHASPFLVGVLVLLLACSAIASASETALFSLSDKDRRKAGERVEALMRDPRALLIAILFTNLLVNVMFFAFASNVDVGEEGWKELVRDLVTVFAVLTIGEVLPKTLALRARIPLARVAAVPFGALTAALRPLIRLVAWAIEVAYRALGEAGREEAGIRSEDLEKALEKSVERGLLHDSEAEILSGIVGLQNVRVREIMTPRVDMLFLDLNAADRRSIVEKALERKEPWILVVDEHPDKVLGRVRLRDLVKDPGRPLEEILTPVRFVPEVASALAALHDLRDSHVAQAVAVDEWGGTAGLVTLENIMEEVVGDLRVEGETPERAVVPLGPGHFRVVGDLPIREWNEHFGRRVVATEFETVAGLVGALLGRIPRVGDEVRSGGLVLAVHKIQRRRITEVDIRVDAAAPAREEARP